MILNIFIIQNYYYYKRYKINETIFIQKGEKKGSDDPPVRINASIVCKTHPKGKLNSRDKADYCHG